MIPHPPSLAQFVRDWLGMTHLEKLMTKQNEALDAVTAKVADVAADTRALVEQLQSEKENLSPAGQDALDRLNTTVDALDAAVGDADGSDTPAPVDPNA